MKAALALLVVCTLVGAQTPPALPPLEPYSLPCLPKEVAGTGTWSTVRTNEAGVTRWHYCNDGFVWRITFEAYPWTSIYNPANWALFNAVKTSLPAAQAAAVANLTAPLEGSTLAPVWKPWYTEMHAQFPESLWVVALNGAALTRPVYRLAADGKRIPQVAGLTPVVKDGKRMPCAMGLRILEWPLYYGKIPGSDPPAVTVCTRR